MMNVACKPISFENASLDAASISSLAQWKDAHPLRYRVPVARCCPSKPLDLDKARAERIAFNVVETLLTQDDFVPVTDIVGHLRMISTPARREQIVRLLFRNHGGLMGVERAWDDIRQEMIDATELMRLAPVWVRCVDRISAQYFN